MDPVTGSETPAGAGSGTRIERILCPVDFSQWSLIAYRHAQSIAGRYRAGLVVQHIIELEQCVSALYAPRLELFEEFLRTRRANALEDLQRIVSTSGGTAPEIIVEEGIPADAILSLARSRAMSLIVLGTHGRRGLDHLMLGSVTERVLRHASCPVLAVKQGAADDPVPIRRIVCCVDFSAHSRRALEYALSAAEAYDAEVSVLHVLDDISGSADIGTETAAAMDKLEKLFPAAAPRSTKTHLEVRLGKAYQEILNFATEIQADLIVTGVRGRNSLDLAVFGSTIYRVMQLGQAAVLAVPIQRVLSASLRDRN